MSSDFRGASSFGQPAGPLKTSGTATLALSAGVLSFFCLFGLGGVLAIMLGVVAHQEIERSEGRVSGKGLASAGIGLGIANLVVTLVGVGVLVALAARPAARPASVTAPPPLPLPVLPAPTIPKRLPVAPPPQAEAAEVEPSLPALPARVGKIAIVEAAAGSEQLETLLLAQLRESAQAGESVVLWTVTPDCEPCDAVGRALPDARMQRALAKVRLVRADAATFTGELRGMGVPIDSVPGFTLLDAHARPVDHIHGGEWDADIPANIAPILERFLRHSLSARRHPWSRPLRDDETPL